MAVSIVKLVGQGLNNTVITGGLVPKGAYNAATDYAVGDSVDYLGSSYVMHTNAVAGIVPTNTTYWQILAEKGDTGSTGATGATGAAGSINWLGEYSNATAYVIDDAVSYNGSSYINILASTGNIPTNTTYWNLMASIGESEVRNNLATVNTIDATVTGTTTLITVPTGKQLVITYVNIRTTSFTSGGKTINAGGNIGIINPTYTDWYDSSNNYTQKFNANNQTFQIFPINSFYSNGIPLAIFQAGDVVKLKISTASNASVEVWTVEVWGYYLGETGVVGVPGAAGAAGQGVPTGGTLNQVLKKASATNYDTVWGDETSVSSVEVYNEVPSGTINNSNTVFTTLNNYVAGKIRIYLNTARQTITNDYTETGVNEITFTSAPRTGDIIIVDYTKS